MHIVNWELEPVCFQNEEMGFCFWEELVLESLNVRVEIEILISNVSSA